MTRVPLRILRALHVAQRIEAHSRGLCSTYRVGKRLAKMFGTSPGFEVEIVHRFTADPSRLATDVIQETRYLRVRLRQFEADLRRQFESVESR